MHRHKLILYENRTKRCLIGMVVYGCSKLISAHIGAAWHALIRLKNI